MEVIQSITDMFFSWESRTHWLFLLFFCCFAVCYTPYMHSWKEQAKHPSVWLDVWLMVANRLLFLLFGGVLSWNTWKLAIVFVSLLDQYLGRIEIDVSPDLLTVVVAVYSVSLFVAWDASRFLLHWMMHRVPLLWKFHTIHHSAEVLTPLTFHRVHPVESIVYQVREYVVSAIVTGVFYWMFRVSILQWEFFGVSAIALLCNGIFGNLRHSSLWISFPTCIEKYCISPAQHQLHHSADIEHRNCNFGTWLSVWDRMCGTLQYSNTPPKEFGIDTEQNTVEHSLFWAWFSPFASIAKQCPYTKHIIWMFFLWCLCIQYSNAQEDTSTEEDTTGTDKQESSATIIVYDDNSIVEAGAAYAISPEKLELLQLSNIEKIVQTIPGVSIRSEDGFGLRPNIGIRGANSDRSAKITLMEDGVLFAPAPYAAPAAYYFPMASRLVGVEVFKGASSTKYGPQTIGGAINLLTRPIPNKQETQAKISYGSYNSVQAHAYTGNTGANIAWLLEGTHAQTDGFKQLEPAQNTGFTKNEFMLKIANTSPINSVQVKLGYANEKSNETYLGLTKTDWSANPYYRYPASALGLMEWKRSQAQLQWIRHAQNGSVSKTVLYHHYLDRSWRKFVGFVADIDIHDLLIADPKTGIGALYLGVLKGEEDTLDTDQELRIGTNTRNFHSFGLQHAWKNSVFFGDIEHNIELGARVHGDIVNRIHTEKRYAMLDASLHPTENPTQTVLESTVGALAMATYVYDTVHWKDVYIYPSLRMENIVTSANLSEQIDRQWQQMFLPGFGFLWKQNDWNTLFTSVYRGFSPIAPEQAKDSIPEQSINYEVGWRQQQDMQHVEIIAFWNAYKNITGVCSFSSGCVEDIGQQYNGGTASIYGVETLLGYSWLLPSGIEIPVNISYAYTDTQFLSDFISGFSQFGMVQAGDFLPYVAKHQLHVFPSVELPHSKIAINFQYTSKMLDQAGTFEDTRSTQVPSIYTVDISGEHTFATLKNKPKLYFSVQNALHTDTITSFRPYGARPIAPRWVNMGVTYVK